MTHSATEREQAKEEGTERGFTDSLKRGVAKPLKGTARTVWLDYVVGPALAYTRRSALRTEDRNVYMARVDPKEVVYSKLFSPGDLPVTGENAVCGATGGPGID